MLPDASTGKIEWIKSYSNFSNFELKQISGDQWGDAATAFQANFVDVNGDGKSELIGSGSLSDGSKSSDTEGLTNNGAINIFDWEQILESLK